MKAKAILRTALVATAVTGLAFTSMGPAPAAQASVATCQNVDTSMKKKLRVGDSGMSVMLLQCVLQDLNFIVEVDGKFGPKTLGAVKTIQAWNGLSIDGVVGAQAWRLLLAKSDRY